MKKSVFAIVCVAFLAVPFVFSGEEVTGQGVDGCNKCMRNESASCEPVIVVTNGGTETVYHVVQNSVASDFHGSHVCQGSKTVTFTGTVEEQGGKKLLTLASIAEV
jgi:hypothetical protein